jgi:hypothetical protein
MESCLFIVKEGFLLEYVENGIPTYAMRFMMGKAIPSSDAPYVEVLICQSSINN